MKPQRIQLSRKRGFNLQAASHALNGLPAVNCARPTRMGNPFKIGGWFAFGFAGMTWCQALSAEIAARTPGRFTLIATQQQAVDWFRKLKEAHPLTTKEVDELRGKNLACWCEIGTPCHVDVLLEKANL